MIGPLSLHAFYMWNICVQRRTEEQNNHLLRHFKGMATSASLAEWWSTFTSLVTAIPSPCSSRSDSSEIPLEIFDSFGNDPRKVKELSLCSQVGFAVAQSFAHWTPTRDMLRAESLSSAVLKSSRMTESVRSLKTKASFQNGLIPMGMLALKRSVTAHMSMIVKTSDRIIAISMIAKRGEKHINSKRLKL